MDGAAASVLHDAVHLLRAMGYAEVQHHLHQIADQPGNLEPLLQTCAACLRENVWLSW